MKFYWIRRQHPHEVGCIYHAGHCHSDACLPGHYEYTDCGLCGPKYDSPKFQFALSRQNESRDLLPILLSDFISPPTRIRISIERWKPGESDYLVDNRFHEPSDHLFIHQRNLSGVPPLASSGEKLLIL